MVILIETYHKGSQGKSISLKIILVWDTGIPGQVVRVQCKTKKGNNSAMVWYHPTDFSVCRFLLIAFGLKLYLIEQCLDIKCLNQLF